MAQVVRKARVAGWARRIAEGHAWKHRKEFEALGIQDQEQFAMLIEHIVENADESFVTESGGVVRQVYWHHGSQTIVIRNSADGDGGTAFPPDDGFGYFKEQLADAIKDGILKE